MFCDPGLQSKKKQEPEKPNILFIIADDLADRMACSGDQLAVTPNLDKLAERGVLFTNTYCLSLMWPKPLIHANRTLSLGKWSHYKFTEDV